MPSLKFWWACDETSSSGSGPVCFPRARDVSANRVPVDFLKGLSVSTDFVSIRLTPYPRWQTGRQLFRTHHSPEVSQLYLSGTLDWRAPRFPACDVVCSSHLQFSAATATSVTPLRLRCFMNPSRIGNCVDPPRLTLFVGERIKDSESRPKVRNETWRKATSAPCV